MTSNLATTVYKLAIPRAILRSSLMMMIVNSWGLTSVYESIISMGII